MGSTYTDAEKIIAIETIKRHGNNIRDALPDIRDLIGKPVTERTVYNWWKARSRIEKLKVVSVTQKNEVEILHTDWAGESLDDVFERVARKYLARAENDSAIEKTSGQAAVTSAAIAVDKMRLLRNLPTEIVGILPGLVESIQRAGHDPALVLAKLKERFDGYNH